MGNTRFQRLEYYLPDSVRETLREALESRGDEAIPDLLPAGLTALARRVASQPKPEVLLLKNLPEIDYSRDVEERIAQEGDEAVPVSYAYRVACALYAACGLPLRKARLLTQEHGASPKRRELHRDLNPLTMIACLRNDCDAPTLFVDMRDVLAALAPAQKDRIRVTVRWTGSRQPVTGAPHITLTDYEAWLSQFPADAPPLAHLFRLATHDARAIDGMDQSMIDAYYDALNSESHLVALQPGQLAAFHNGYLYHQAVEREEIAREAPEPFRFRRVAMYTAGG